MAPLKEQVSKSALQKLPKRGGLANKVAASKYAVRTKATTVMFQMVNPIDIKSFDEGLIRHPVFGNKNVWVEQKVTPGFWSDPINADKPAIVGVIVELMNETIKKIDG